MFPLPGSGNYLEDSIDEELEQEYRDKDLMECGCWKICKCDYNDE